MTKYLDQAGCKYLISKLKSSSGGSNAYICFLNNTVLGKVAILDTPEYVANKSNGIGISTSGHISFITNGHV